MRPEQRHAAPSAPADVLDLHGVAPRHERHLSFVDGSVDHRRLGLSRCADGGDDGEVVLFQERHDFTELHAYLPR